MLFNSFAFICLFLPVVCLGYYALGRRPRLAIAWLVVASLVFYAAWYPPFLIILSGSIAFNYLAGKALARWPARGLLAAALAGDLGLLAYYKYAAFLIGLLPGLSAWRAAVPAVLPLGISFFTFTQIAYLVDVFRGKARDYGFTKYVLFVTFFPHLIAGPILHHQEMIGQFDRGEIFRFSPRNFAVGLTLFAIGLFKKVMLADMVAPYVKPAFDAAGAGLAPTFLDAWVAVIAYTVQIYYDFSGYSDMALGLALMLNIRLPVNFLSPYRSTSIIEFWRRWHITLSRYLRDYVYIPLGGNRLGEPRRYLNLFATMLIGGVWHGAGWTYIAWGALHGAYLTTNHAWRALSAGRAAGPMARWAGGALTLLAVMVGWAVFRAPSLGAAGRMVAGLTGLNGLSVSPALRASHPVLGALGVQFGGFTPLLTTGLPGSIALALVVLMGVAILAPNAIELTQDFDPALGLGDCRRELAPPVVLRWQPRTAWAVGTAALLWISLAHVNRVSEFIYFQF